jgi:hypothetical protein
MDIKMNLPTVEELQSIADHLRIATDHLRIVSDHLDKVNEKLGAISGDVWNDDSLSLLAEYAVAIHDEATTNKDTRHYVTPLTPPSAREYLVITPISADKKNKAHIDYEEQVQRLQKGQPLLWDDSQFNKSEIGDLFGFWMYNNQVRIHVIEAVSDPQNRMPSWSSNVGQGSRNVVQLSDRCVIISWSKWIELDGAKRCMGTAPVKKGLDAIIGYHRSMW